MPMTITIQTNLNIGESMLTTMIFYADRYGSGGWQTPLREVCRQIYDQMKETDHELLPLFEGVDEWLTDV